MNNHTVSYSFGQSQQSTNFMTIRYKGIDYISEASARRRLLMNLLELPVPLQLVSNIYPHTGQLQDITYRVPWVNKTSTCKLQVTGSVLDDLKAIVCFSECLERFSVFLLQTDRGLEEVVLSSNPASQCSIDIAEALWLDGAVGSVNRSPWEESFSPYTPDSCSFGCKDLTLSEEVIFTDHLHFKNHLPLLQNMLQRLKIMTVSDPFLNPSITLSEDVIFRHCSSYDVVLDKVNATVKGGNDEEKFRKEKEESLMLPEEIVVDSLQRQESSFVKIQDYLTITPEPIEEQIPLNEFLQEEIVTHSDKHKTELEVLEIPDSSLAEITLKEPESPVAFRSYAEMEMDLLLSPSNNPACLSDLFPSGIQLSDEGLSPVHMPCFLSDSDCENMKKAVWMAEKHPQSVAGLLLAEPQRAETFIHNQSLPELLKLLMVEVEQAAEPRENQVQFHLTDSTVMPPENIVRDLSIYTEQMSAEECKAAVRESHGAELFPPLSILQIDVLLTEFAVDSAKPHPNHPSAVHPTQSNTLQTAAPTEVEGGKTVKFLIKEQMFSTKKMTAGIDCKEAQIEQDVSRVVPLKHTTTQGITGNQTEYSTCPSGEQLNLSSAVEASNSPPVKHNVRDIKVLSPLHKHPESDERREETFSKSPLLSDCSRGRQENGSVSKSHEMLDILSSFVMLRTLQKSPAQSPQQSSPNTPEVNMSLSSGEKVLPAFKVNAVHQDTETTKSTVPSDTSFLYEDRPISKTIYVQATGNERDAYRELYKLALPSLRKVQEFGLAALSSREFSTLSSELTRFLLKQQERQLNTEQGGERVFNEMALLHILVTVKETLLRCDLHTAAVYLAKAKDSCTLSCLDELLRRFEVLQYLTQKKQEPNPKLLELQEQIDTWINTHTNHNTRVLVLTANSISTELLAALSQVSGNSVSAVLPEEGKCKVARRKVMDSLCSSACVVMRSQHVGPDFPWQSFGLVLEVQCAGHSPFSSVCLERNISYITFTTTVPDSHFMEDCSTASYLDTIPFVLFITEGFLKRSAILHTLESKFNITLLERKHSPSAQMLGGTNHYDVITVDENTAIFIQELSELEMDRASERVVMRLSALSLQFTHCWVILQCAETHSALISSSIYSNLVLIYSTFVLFGHKSEDFDVKVLLVCEEADIAKYIYHISLHTLMSSERDGLSWLDRDWISLESTEAEDFLLNFPCINPLVAQLMLRSAPSLQWLLGASSSELQDMFPQLPHKVIELFSSITALHKHNTDALEGEHESSLQTNSTAQPPHPPLPLWAQDLESDQWICHTQQPVQFTLSLSEHQENTTHLDQFTEYTAQEDNVSADSIRTAEEETSTETHFPLMPSQFSRGSAARNIWQTQSEEHFHSDMLVSGQFAPRGSTRLLSAPLLCPEELGWRHYCSSPENSASRKTGEERKREAEENMQNVLPQCKRRKLVFERVPGRNDGQTRLRFF